MPLHLPIFLLATLTLIAGCNKPTTTTSGKLTGFPSIGSAEDAISLATVKFVKVMPGEFRTSRPDGAFTVNFKNDNHDALLQTNTAKSADGTYEIGWTFTVSGSDPKHNAKVANLLTKSIAEVDSNRPQ